MTTPALTLVARSSSHFSRITRIYAAELEIPYVLAPVFDIKSTDPLAFGDNPLLRVPSLRTPEGTWFGSLNVCRELARRTALPARLVWPEDLTDPLSANAQEIVLDAMGTGVVIVTARGAEIPDDSPSLVKPFARLEAAIAWLESSLDSAIATLPERQVSFLEVSAFCLLTHLGFRGLGTIDDRPRLLAFSERFGTRPSARTTAYRFDQPPAL
jgi:glutathione S-transferase